MSTFLQILGSLGIFLFGMKVLTEGIQKTAGDRMRTVMATMTKNRFGGVFTGLFTTSLLQSSSATTVIVVSFVNAGLLTLIESIGVIMGANLGTTVTAWIIAAVGKFNVSEIAIPIVGLGMPLLFIGKDKLKSLGEVLIGFGLLFFGLGLLKDAVPDVKSMLASTDPEVKAHAEAVLEVVKGLSGHWYSLFLFLALGILLTIVVQSSSAAMAITVTLAIQGWIGFEDSCGIVLGENIGTTVTAWLASLGANASAKRAARAHFLFNVIGVCWMLLVFHLFFGDFVRWLAASLPGTLSEAGGIKGGQIGFELAIFHTTFNLLNICLLVGFVPQIAKIVEWWVKDKDGGQHRLTFISQNLVDVGELNLPEARKAVSELAVLTQRMFDGFNDVFNHPGEDMSTQVIALKQMEDQSDTMMNDITEYLVRCSASELSQSNAASVTAMLRITAELEEIADCIYRLVKLTEKKYRKNRQFSEETLASISEFADQVSRFITLYNDRIFNPISAQDIKDARELEDAIDNLRRTLNRKSVARMQEQGDIKAEMLSIDINNHFEKIGNHALNIIETAQHARVEHPRGHRS